MNLRFIFLLSESRSLKVGVDGKGEEEGAGGWEDEDRVVCDSFGKVSREVARLW